MVVTEELGWHDAICWFGATCGAIHWHAAVYIVWIQVMVHVGSWLV